MYTCLRSTTRDRTWNHGTQNLGTCSPVCRRSWIIPAAFSQYCSDQRFGGYCQNWCQSWHFSRRHPLAYFPVRCLLHGGEREIRANRGSGRTGWDPCGRDPRVGAWQVRAVYRYAPPTCPDTTPTCSRPTPARPPPDPRPTPARPPQTFLH